MYLSCFHFSTVQRPWQQVICHTVGVSAQDMKPFLFFSNPKTDENQAGTRKDGWIVIAKNKCKMQYGDDWYPQSTLHRPFLNLTSYILLSYASSKHRYLHQGMTITCYVFKIEGSLLTNHSTKEYLATCQLIWSREWSLSAKLKVTSIT